MATASPASPELELRDKRVSGVVRCLVSGSAGDAWLITDGSFGSGRPRQKACRRYHAMCCGPGPKAAEHVLSAGLASAGGDGDRVPISDYQNAQFFGPIRIGGQDFQVAGTQWGASR